MQDCNMVLIGRKATGKTTYLATLAHQFSAVHADLQFSFQTSPEQGTELQTIYQQIGRGYIATPPSAAQKPWAFTCSCQGQLPLRLTYLDYSGDTQLAGPGSETVLEYVRHANILMGLIDGNTVAACLHHKMHPERSKEWAQLSADLDQLLAILRKGDGALPTHFVVSKWDLLGEDSDKRLGMVRDLLLHHQGLRQYCEQHLANGIPLRVIPITTLGFEFFRRTLFWTSARRDAEPQPVYIEIPIAYALVDQVAMMQRQLEAEIRRQTPPSDSDTAYTRNERLQLAVADGIEMAINKTPEIAAMLVQMGMKMLADQSGSNRSHQQSDALRNLSAVPSAVTGMLPESFRNWLGKFAHRTSDRVRSGPQQRQEQAEVRLRRAMDDYQRQRKAKLDEAAAYQRIVENCQLYTKQWLVRFPNSHLIGVS